MSTWSKLFSNFQWQNRPSTATPLGKINLQKLNDAIDGIDDRVVSLKDDKAETTDVTTALAGKVDKVAGKGLSTNDFDNTYKNKLDGISEQANKVEITPVVTEGTTLATISIDGVDTDIKGSDIDVDSAMSPTSENPVQNKVITNAFVEMSKQKADKNGEITSAKASYSLLCDTPVNDNAPYTYRQFPVANAKLEKLKKLIGASVVWNQLVQNGNFADTANWRTNGSATTFSTSNNMAVVSTSSNNGGIYSNNISLVANHKYIYSFDVKNTVAMNCGFSQFSSGRQAIPVNSTSTRYTFIGAPSSDGNGQFAFYSASADSNSIEIKNVYLTDLTAMFGSTIADYVNTLETAQAGSGIAWLKSYGFFTEDYYAYSVNTIQSVSVSGHKVVGKNLFGGTYDNLFPLHFANNTQITVSAKTSSAFRFGYYDINENLIDYYGVNTTFGDRKYRTITLPKETYFVNFYHVFVEDMQIELGSTATAYKPYTAETTTLDHTTLRGLFKLDANNNLYADGDIYNADGSRSVKYAEVDLGSLYWTYTGSGATLRFQTALTSVKGINNNTIIPNFVCLNYETKSWDNIGTNDKFITKQGGDNNVVAIADSSYTDEATFKTAMSGVKLIYELATPTTATLTPFNPLSDIEQGGTEEFVDYGVQQSTRDVAIPCGTDTDFYQGLSLPTVPTTDETYVLKATVSSGTATLSWVAE